MKMEADSKEFNLRDEYFFFFQFSHETSSYESAPLFLFRRTIPDWPLSPPRNEMKPSSLGTKSFHFQEEFVNFPLLFHDNKFLICHECKLAGRKRSNATNSMIRAEADPYC